MIKPLRIGSKLFPINLIQGPLAGVSCAPFRLLTWRYSQPAFSCTEMISTKTLLYASARSQQRFVEKDPEEGPVCFQLASHDPIELAEATKKVTNMGADVIDLNCGCPVKKIRSKGAGSKLLTEPLKLYQLISTMKKNTTLPVSVKIRVQGEDEEFNREVATVVSDAGADCLVVHGRHWREHYETPCRYEDIQFFVENLKIPVIGNGDIACVDSLMKMWKTGCAGVMLSRAGVGQPWLIRQLMSQVTYNTYTPPLMKERGAIFVEHIERLATLLGSEKFSLLQARKIAKYYARSLPAKNEFCNAVNVCSSMEDFKAACTHYFRELMADSN